MLQLIDVRVGGGVHRRADEEVGRGGAPPLWSAMTPRRRDEGAAAPVYGKPDGFEVSKSVILVPIRVCTVVL